MAHVKCYYETKLVMLMLIYSQGSGNTCASLVSSLKCGYDSAVGRNMDLLLVSGYWHLSRCGIKRDAGSIHVSYTEFPDKRRMFCIEAGGTLFSAGWMQPAWLFIVWCLELVWLHGHGRSSIRAVIKIFHHQYANKFCIFGLSCVLFNIFPCVIAFS